MQIEFDEKKHTYSVNGDIASISVTELLHKHGLAPDYSGVPSSVLKASAKRGKEIHKDLENVLNTAGYQPTTAQGELWKEWVFHNLDCGVGEQMLAYEYEGMWFAGTADVMGLTKNGEFIVGDHKVMANINREYVSWQVSLLDYFARHLDGVTVNSRHFIWTGAKVFKCFRYGVENGDFEVIDLPKVPDEEIEKLIRAEYNGEIYQRPQLVVTDELRKQVEMAETALAIFEEEYKTAKATAETLRKELCEAMEKQGIKSWETDKVRVTYVAPIERLTVDSTKVRREYPQVFEKCSKISKVGASVRIKVKGGNDDEF